MISVRPAAGADSSAIAEIEKSAFHDPLTTEMIQRFIASPDIAVLCATEGDTVCGYVSMQVVLDEGYINNIAVLPEFRRRGMGRALLDALDAEGRRKELTFITLEVRESNAGAIALYGQCGYGKIGLRRNYYEKPKENAIIMTRFFK